jgi:hypothetical protein
MVPSPPPQNSKSPSKAGPCLFSPMLSKMNHSDGATGVAGIQVGTDPTASGIRRREFIPEPPEHKEGSKRRRRNKSRERSHSCTPSCNHDHVEDVQHFATLNEDSAGRSTLWEALLPDFTGPTTRALYADWLNPVEKVLDSIRKNKAMQAPGKEARYARPASYR